MNPIWENPDGAGLARALTPVFLDAALKGVLLLSLAWLVTAGMKRRSAAARHLVWFLSVAALLVLPLLSWCLPGWHVLPRWADTRPAKEAAAPRQRPAPVMSATANEPSTMPVEVIRAREPEELVPPTAAGPEMREPRATPAAKPVVQIANKARPTTSWRWGWWWLWLAGALLALLPVALGTASLWRLGRAARPETAPAWLELLQTLLARLRFRRPVVLLKTDRRRMPMTWGLLPPKLLLPEESEAWPPDRRRVVLLHELAHARRWDYLTNLVTQLVCALHWFNPLVWLAARRMVAERERACDDIVLNHGAKPADYAEQILQIAAGLPLGRLASFGGIPMARPSKLEGRLRAILDGQQNRAALTRAVVIAMMVLLTMVVVPVAMMKAAPANVGGVSLNANGVTTNLPVCDWKTNTSLFMGARQSALAIRISAVTNAISPVARQLAWGRTDVLELPIRIENRSTNTISARIAHEWYGGEWPETDLGAAVRHLDDPKTDWNVGQVYLSGELGTKTEPGIWQPGQSREFTLRLNWPGTGSVHARPLIDAKNLGRYSLQISLVFQAGGAREYVVSPEMEIAVEKGPPPPPFSPRRNNDSAAETNAAAAGAAPLEEGKLREWLSQSEAVVVGKVLERVGAGSISFGKIQFTFPVEVKQAIKGNFTPGSSLFVSVQQAIEGTGSLHLPVKGDEMVLFINDTGGITRRSPENPEGTNVWSTIGVDMGLEPATPAAIAAVKKLNAGVAGQKQSEELVPAKPFRAPESFGPRTLPPDLRRTEMNVRLMMMTNVVRATWKTTVNGTVKVLEFPLQIENRSDRTITATIPHETAEGHLPMSDLGGAFFVVMPPSVPWRTTEIYLSGEESNTNMNISWSPGQSHKFVLRLNYAGTHARPLPPLMETGTTGEFLQLRFSLIFKAAGASEYAVSQVMDVKIEKSQPAPSAAAPASVRERIEQLIKTAPMTTNLSELEIYDPVLGANYPKHFLSNGVDMVTFSDKIRTNVVRYGYYNDDSSTDLVLGQVYQPPGQNRFYISWDQLSRLSSGESHFYGPFTGDPVQVLAPPEQKNQEPSGRGFVSNPKWREPDNPLGLDDETVIRFFKTGQRLQNLIYSLGAANFQNRTNRPRSVDELYANTINRDEIVRDPFGAEKLRLEYPPGKIRISSVGPDGKWDGGKIIKGDDTNLSGDVGVELEPGKMDIHWLAEGAVLAYLQGHHTARYLAQKGPRSSVQPQPTANEKLKFGPVMDGLQAAVELINSNGSFVLSEAIEVRFHIRNKTNYDIQIAGPSWRQDLGDDFIILDEQGRRVAVNGSWRSGIDPVQREVLKPDQEAVFRSSTLEFLSPTVGAQPNRPVGHGATVAKPGKYTIHVRVRFPGFNAQLMDWQGTLDTGTVELEVKDPATVQSATNSADKGGGDSVKPGSNAPPASVLDRVEHLITGTPATINVGAVEIFEKTPGLASYHLRSNLVRWPLSAGPGETRTNLPQAEVFYLTASNRFYVRWDAARVSARHYYGPFQGDPAKVLGLPPQTNAPANMPATNQSAGGAALPTNSIRTDEALVQSQLQDAQKQMEAVIAAAPKDFSVLVTPSVTECRVGQDFDLRLEIKNPAATNQTFSLLSQDWYKQWRPSNPALVWKGSDYLSRSGGRREAPDQIVRINLKPDESYVTNLTVHVVNRPADGKFSFHMGFRTDRPRNDFGIGLEAIIPGALWKRSYNQAFWSDEVTLAVLPETDSPSASATPASALRSTNQYSKAEWGSAVDGLSVRLEAEKLVWPAGEAPRFKVAVRNRSGSDIFINKSVEVGGFELDGGPLLWTYPISPFSGPLRIGEVVEKSPLALDDGWERAHIFVRGTNGFEAAWPMPRLGPGTHTVRFAVEALSNPYDTYGAIDAFSNPVEIEILPAAGGPRASRSMPAGNLVSVGGTVVDADTHQPIPNAKITPGYYGAPDFLQWDPTARHAGQIGPDGAYRFEELPYPLPPMAIKAEASGYLPEMASLSGSNRHLTLNFELHQGDGFGGTVMDTDGRPAQHARAFYNLRNGLQLFNERKLPLLLPLSGFGRLTDLIHFTPSVATDANGHVKLRGTPGIQSLVVFSEQGFAEIPRELLEPDMTIHLQPLGKTAETAAVQGLQVQLGAEQTAWQEGQTPRLRVDIRNTGSDRLVIPTNARLWRVEIDGKWRIGRFAGEAGDLKPGAIWRDLALVLDGNLNGLDTDLNSKTADRMYGPGGWWLPATFSSHYRLVADGTAYLTNDWQLSPGKHTIRLAVFAAKPGRDTMGVIRAVSDPVEIEVGENR